MANNPKHLSTEAAKANARARELAHPIATPATRDALARGREAFGSGVTPFTVTPDGNATPDPRVETSREED